jgi:hypothetical protein
MLDACWASGVLTGVYQPRVGAQTDLIARATRLTALIRPYLPLRVPPAESEWEILAPALLARMTASVEAIVQLRPLGRTADEIVLGRSLYDHATTFAWLAADPAGRLDRFLHTDAVERLKLGNHSEELGIQMLEAETRKHFESVRDAGAESMPSLLVRAQEADTDWGEKLPEHSSAAFMSYIGQYASFYRHHSGFEHTSTLGLLAFATLHPDGSAFVGMEEEESDALLGTVLIVYAWSLIIAAERFGWPSEEAVAAEILTWWQERGL